MATCASEENTYQLVISAGLSSMSCIDALLRDNIADDRVGSLKQLRESCESLVELLNDTSEGHRLHLQQILETRKAVTVFIEIAECLSQVKSKRPKTKVEKAQKRIGDLRGVIDDIKARIKDKRQLLIDSDIKKRLDANDHEMETLHERVDKTESVQKKVTGRVQECEHSFGKQAVDLEDRVTANNSKLKNLEDTVRDKVQEFENRIGKTDDLQGRVIATDKKVQDLEDRDQKQNKEIWQELKKMRKGLENVQKAVNANSSRLTSHEADIRKLERDLQKAKIAKEKEDRRVQSQFGKVEDQIESVEGQIENLTGSCQILADVMVRGNSNTTVTGNSNTLYVSAMTNPDDLRARNSNDNSETMSESED